MLFLLSPAKKLDYETPVPASLRRSVTDPVFGDQAAELVALLRRMSPAQVASLMDLSDPLAQLAVARFGAWQDKADAGNSKPALLAFAGDVYRGLDAATLAATDLRWAQQHLVILSGLYGALRPLDRLQPYRLEMHSAVATPRGANLYDWWGDRIVGELNRRQADEAAPVVVNLASAEYARAALRPGLRARVVDCVFEQVGPDGRARIVAIHAKRARGLMARHAIVRRARTPAALRTFDTEGWAYCAAASTPERLVFRREEAGGRLVG